MEKLTNQFADMYRNTLRVKGFSEPEQKTDSYISRLERMYTSEKYQEYSISPSMGIDNYGKCDMSQYREGSFRYAQASL